MKNKIQIESLKSSIEVNIEELTKNFDQSITNLIEYDGEIREYAKNAWNIIRNKQILTSTIPYHLTDGVLEKISKLKNIKELQELARNDEGVANNISFIRDIGYLQNVTSFEHLALLLSQFNRNFQILTIDMKPTIFIPPTLNLESKTKQLHAEGGALFAIVFAQELLKIINQNKDLDQNTIAIFLQSKVKELDNKARSIEKEYLQSQDANTILLYNKYQKKLAGLI